MSQYDCQNLTETISNLSNLNARIDSVFYNLNAESGLKIKAELQETMSLPILIARLGLKGFETLVANLGSVEKLQSRVLNVTLGNKTRAEIAKELVEKKIDIFGISVDHLLDKLPEVLPEKAESIMTIRLSSRELGLKSSSYLGDIIRQARIYGLKICPMELGLPLRLADTDQPAGGYAMMMNPIRDAEFSSGVAYLYSLLAAQDGEKSFGPQAITAHSKVWSREAEFVFVLPEKKKLN
jgi:hypothetical protein